ncbi:MAG: glycosyltransferase family 4 protein [Synechococcaceae cyanobacterium]|nr:glycosyltransferase family 4 protein [Synechococcaceae cyanobacterium]
MVRQLGLEILPQRLRWRRERSRLARLTVVSQFFPPDFAATGQFVDDLSRRLSERGLQILVLSGQPGYAYHADRAERIEFQHNRCIRRTSVSRFWPDRIRGRVVNSLLFCLRTVLRLLRQARRGDLLLFTTEPAYLPVVGWLTHLITRAPYIVLIYDLYPDIAVSLDVVPESHPLVRLWTWLHTRTFASAQELIVLSDTMQERLRQHYPSVSTPISVIPNWADPHQIRPMPRHSNWFVQRYDLQDTFTVLYSGNQGRCHDLFTLIDAAAVLRDHPRIRFLLVGSGPRNRELQARVKQSGIRNVRFLPYQDADALPQMLAAADLAVISLLAEAEGQVAPCKLYGHLAAGAPLAVICSDRSYLRREVARAGCGRCFASGEHEALAEWIVQLAADPVLCEDLGKAGRRYLLSTATPELAVQAYAEVLARHLPLDHKTYAQPLHDGAIPLPTP